MKLKNCSVIEIAGLCGAGKSTLSRALIKRGNHIRAGLSIWQNSKQSLAASFVSALPEIAQRSFEDGRLAIDTAKQLVRLATLERQITGRGSGANHPKQFFAIDEGAVFLLTKNCFERKSAQLSLLPFEKCALEKWSANIDAIVWLDAPNEILIKRIREREKKHRMKFQSDYETNDFLDRYRAAYEKVFLEFERISAIEIRRFNTAENSPEQIADDMVGFFDWHSRKFRHKPSKTDSENYSYEN